MIKKLGPHILGNSSAAATWLRAGAPVVKLVGDFSLAPEAAMLPHRPIVLGRIVETFLDPNRLINNDPATQAREYVSTFLESHIRLNPAVSHWEGPNECVITELPAMRWYAVFLNEFARILRTQFNRTPVIGGWAVGNPDYPMWAEYVPALQAVSQYGAILSRHSYAGPDRSTWGFLLLRHREDNRIFSQMGFPNLPLLITECGADGVPFGNPPGQSWRDLYGNDAQRYYAEILEPFDAELQNDSYVLGATVFTSGDGWGQHNIDPEPTGILAANTVPGISPPPPPPPDDSTHIVKARALNVRAHPWTTHTPPLVRQLAFGDRVRVLGQYHIPNVATPWACIREWGEWVSMRYLEEIK